MCLLLLQQNRTYENPTTTNEYTACLQSMRNRYLKRIFIIGKAIIVSSECTKNKPIGFPLVQWLPTLSKAQLKDFQTNHERYVCSNRRFCWLFSHSTALDCLDSRTIISCNVFTR